MIDAIMAVLGSSTVGGIVGGVMGIFQRREDRKYQEQQNEFEIRRIKHESIAGVATSEARAFEHSQKPDPSIGGIIKSAVRPILTGILYYEVYVLIIAIESLTGGLSSIDSAELLDLYRTIVLSVLSLCSMATSWWFASRPSGLPQMVWKPK
jgi:hypothetical protein